VQGGPCLSNRHLHKVLIGTAKYSATSSARQSGLGRGAAVSTSVIVLSLQDRDRRLSTRLLTDNGHSGSLSLVIESGERPCAYVGGICGELPGVATAADS
jgi:hypothetical protein